MENKLKKKYGLFTAICMVVGTVIGSGVFFKAGKVLTNTDGNMAKSLLTVAIVGIIMLICSYVFSILARKHEKVNGIVDYAEVSLGTGYGYAVGWFMTVMYYPALTSCLAWISANYTCTLFGFEPTSGLHLTLAALYLILGYAINSLSPKIAGHVQVSATIIKLIPLAIMAIAGTICGLVNGLTIEAFTTNTAAGAASHGGILAAVVAFAFSYEGWIITTSINAELKDSKKNLPRALVIGAIIVIAVYLAYFLGLSGVLPVEKLMNPDANAVPKEAFSVLFGSPVFGTIAFVFIVLSCLGTMNGLMLGCCRGMYSVAVRGKGPKPEVFSQVDKVTNMPTNSAILGLALCAIWLFQWQFGLIGNVLPAIIAWENDELPIITLYAAYIPIFVVLMAKGKELNIFQRFVMPTLAIICCIFMVLSAIYTYKIQALYYIIVFAVVMLIGLLFAKTKNIEEPKVKVEVEAK